MPLLAFLALLVLLGGVFLIPVRAKPTASSPEVPYLQHMITHHAQATTLSFLIFKRSQNRTLRSMALDIRLSQQEQMIQMENWLKMWGQPTQIAITDEQRRMMGMSTLAEVKSLKTLPIAEAETRFVQLMLRHHQGAIRMMQPMLETQIRTEVRLLAKRMNTMQLGETLTLQRMLKQRGAVPLPNSQNMQMPEHSH